MSFLYDMIKEMLLDYRIYPKLATYGAALATFIIMVILSMILFIIIRTILLRIITKIIKRTRGIWGESLYKNRVFQVLTHFIPAVLIYGSSDFASGDLIWIPPAIHGLARIYISIVLISASVRFLSSAQDIYDTYPYARERTIKGYIQLMKIFIYCSGGIFILAILIGQNPAAIFAGLGAMAAVLVFVFRDPILGFVASIQLAANKMVKQGDWITVPKYNIDGTVEDITLTTVKIKNWDKTMTTIPTYSLVSESMINWKGMLESGGRRIQRAIYLDISSIRFCNEAYIEKLKDNKYVGKILRKIKLVIPSDGEVTNLSLFKQYIEEYCNVHPVIHQNMTKMVRLLPPGEKGLPIEFTFFSKHQEANAYENLHTEVLDHLLSVLPEFNLRVFQNTSVLN